MDPASAIIGFVTTGIQVVKLVMETIDDIKNAPKELELLRDRAANIEASLKELKRRQLDGLFESEEDIEILETTGRRAKTWLDEITVFTAKVQKTKPSKDGAAAVDKFRWILKGDTLKGLSGQLDRLDAMLTAVMNLVNSRSQSRQERSQARQEQTLTILIEEMRSRQPVGFYATRQPPTLPNSRNYITPSDKLFCSSDCACRCHSPLSKPIVPTPVVPYIGQVLVPKRILHAIGISSWECNVQTCRRDRKTRHRLTWVAWWWYMTVSVSSRSLTMSLHPPRVVPGHAPVWEVLYWGDIHALQALFAAGQSSVYDVSEHGYSLLEYACRIWARERSQDVLKVIRFLKEAGADPEFMIGRWGSVTETVSHASLATLIEQPHSNFLHAVRTSTVGVDICRTILGLDIVDIIEDYLSNHARHDAAQLLFRQPFEDRPEDAAVNAEAIIQAYGWSNVLEYSIWYMPEDSDATLRLMQSGMEIPEYCLPAAMDWGEIKIVKILLNAGADVNGRSNSGYTALHHACHHLRIDMLELLVEFAGESIDWDARTPQGENALRIAKREQLTSRTPLSELERMFDILRAHISDVDEDGLEDWENASCSIPGAFPTLG